jgi:hypothetical protein
MNVLVEFTSSKGENVMAVLTAKQVYQQYIQDIPAAEQLELIALISTRLAIQSPLAEKKTRSLLELEGLGAEIWKGVDAQDYVDTLRDEWEFDGPACSLSCSYT